MTEKKLSRRDAMKMLGVAVGAAALANLPSKWNTPEVVAGVLPAHARQSAGTCTTIVRSAVIGTVPGDNTMYYFPLNAPITAAEIAACLRREIRFEWTGTSPVPLTNADYVFELQNAADSWVSNTADSSPVTSTNTDLWAGAPFTHLGAGISFGNGAWNIGTLTVTII